MADDHICDAGDFDRTICPEPCGMMHSYCTTCGARADRCPRDEAPDPIHWKARHDELAAALAALADAELSEARDHASGLARADVRCTRCDLRWEERQEYGCRWPGEGHSYDEAELADAASRAADEVDEMCVSVDLPDLRALVADPAAVLADRDRRVKAEALEEAAEAWSARSLSQSQPWFFPPLGNRERQRSAREGGPMTEDLYPPGHDAHVCDIGSPERLPDRLLRRCDTCGRWWRKGESDWGACWWRVRWWHFRDRARIRDHERNSR